MRVADALVTVLRDLGLRYVFGVNGPNTEHLHDAVHRLGAGRLTSVLAKREDGAANMADARARVHRTLGVCCASSGGGMMNLVAGLAESYAQSVPVLAIIGQPPAAMDGRGSFQDSSGLGRSVDARALLVPVTKWVERVTDAESFWFKLYTTMAATVTGRMGPAAMLIPRDRYDLEVGPVPGDLPRDLAGFGHPSPVESDQVADLFQRLRTARRPVLLVGHGVRRSTSPEAVVKFAARARIPVMTTMGARGEFPNDDPCYYGVIGANGHPSASAYLSDQADLVVLVGTGPSLMTRDGVPNWDPQRTVAVNIDPADVAATGVAGTIVRGDAGTVFDELNELLDADPFACQPTEPYQLTRLTEPLPDTSTLTTSRAVSVIEKFLPRDGHLLYDTGNCVAVAMHHSSVPSGCTATSAFGMGTTGYALGGAVGAQLGAPGGTRTVVFCGDGAFLTSGQEIHTAVDLGLPILYVVFNNGGHSPVGVTTMSWGYGVPDRLWVGRAGTEAELVDALTDQRLHAHLPGVLELLLPMPDVPPSAAFTPADLETPTFAG